MSQNADAGKLPGWTLLVSLLGWVIAPMVLWAYHDFGLSWWLSVPTAIVIAVAGVFLERAVERKYLPSRISEIHAKHDGIASVQALDGRIFATLSDDEMATLNFYRDQGRKFGVSVCIDNDADPAELARAVSREQTDQILKRANNRVHVLVAG
ncbi:hypothetical protein [Paraburkholderia tropica]|uniref:hypothetical protein n=1 Tax=Paraburkholderia tropica TaxID=92647 RepID=UPI002AB5EBD5|nr:hypothetical protein [Paraburkholderia tropica]